MAPDKIYVPTRMGLVAPLEVKESDDDVCYIRKDALLEWAKEQKTLMELGGHVSIDDVIDKLNQM